MVCGALGDKDQAFDYLEQAIAQHDDQVSFMAVDHRFDSLRGDPRFEKALRNSLPPGAKPFDDPKP